MKKLPPIHPGEVLLEDFLRPRDISATRLAMDLRIPASRVSAIVRGERSLTADTVLRLARYFGVSVEFWMGLQADYDIATAEDAIGKHIRHDVRPLAIA